MELNYWAGTEFEGGTYDTGQGRWSVTLRRPDGTKRELHPKHIVMATGVSGIPNLPEIPTLGAFRGKVLHSSQYEEGEEWKGKNAIVIGTGNSGHDIAQDLYSAGARVTLVQRSPTLITNIEPSAQLAYALYSEGPPTEDCDLIATSMPLQVAKKSHALLTEQGRRLDKPLLDALERLGFKLDYGEDGTGWQFKYLTRGGGYYFNVGCSDLVAEGKIGLAQFDSIEGFVAQGARMRDGTTLAADLVVHYGEDGTGWQFKYLTRGGGYYFNVGCSDLVAEGKIGLAQFDSIDGFVAQGARMRDGTTLAADLVVLATGYKGQEYLVRKLFGGAVADRVGPIWGFGEEQELRNMYMRTAQPGLWFIAGSLAQCRINSRYLALQIKACELGMLELPLAA